MKNFPIGSPVRLIQPVVSGEVADTEFDKDANELKHLVTYTSEDGETHSRWFPASQLEANGPKPE